jgi:hypothetical protein
LPYPQITAKVVMALMVTVNKTCFNFIFRRFY